MKIGKNSARNKFVYFCKEMKLKSEEKKNLTGSVGVVGDLAGNVDRALLYGAQGRVQAAHFQILLGHVVGDLLGREQEHLLGHVMAAGRDHAERDAREYIGVVALSRFVDFPVVVDFAERRARREYAATLFDGRVSGMITTLILLRSSWEEGFSNIIIMYMINEKFWKKSSGANFLVLIVYFYKNSGER